MWRYVKSGFGGPPSLWRPLHPAQHGAGQSDSRAPSGSAGFRLPPLFLHYSQSPIPKISPSPINRTSLRSLRAVTLFASKKSAPRQPFTPCKQVLRGNPMLSNSGKSPCRSTGKANIQIVARLRRAPASNKPPCKKRSALQNNHHRSSSEQTGAGQSNSYAPQAPLAADCRPSQSTIHKKSISFSHG